MMKVTILGCGGSNGVPIIGNNWGDCDPTNPKNRRRRPSVLIDWDDKTILIDTSPDLRAQLIDANVTHIDAVLYTHAHADHVHGIDDLRSAYRLMRQSIDVYAENQFLENIIGRFGYLFDGGQVDKLYTPFLTPHRIDGPFEAAGHTIIPFDQDHGIGPSTGFRLGDFAYSTDVVNLPDAAFDVLNGVKLWVADCLRVKEHPTHSHLEKTLGWIDRAGAERAILTHMNFQTDYEAFKALCPPGVEPAYDGMVLEI